MLGGKGYKTYHYALTTEPAEWFPKQLQGQKQLMLGLGASEEITSLNDNATVTNARHSL